MGSVNRTIVASTVIIMAAGIYHYFLQGGKKNTTLTRIIIGGYMLGLTASLFDLIGLGVGQVAGWILMLAVGVAVFTVAGDLYGRFAKQQAPANQFGGTNPHTAQA